MFEHPPAPPRHTAAPQAVGASSAPLDAGTSSTPAPVPLLRPQAETQVVAVAAKASPPRPPRPSRRNLAVSSSQPPAVVVSQLPSIMARTKSSRTSSRAMPSQSATSPDRTRAPALTTRTSASLSPSRPPRPLASSQATPSPPQPGRGLAGPSSRAHRPLASAPTDAPIPMPSRLLPGSVDGASPPKPQRAPTANPADYLAKHSGKVKGAFTQVLEKQRVVDAFTQALARRSASVTAGPSKPQGFGRSALLSGGLGPSSGPGAAGPSARPPQAPQQRTSSQLAFTTRPGAGQAGRAAGAGKGQAAGLVDVEVEDLDEL